MGWYTAVGEYDTVVLGSGNDGYCTIHHYDQPSLHLVGCRKATIPRLSFRIPGIIAVAHGTRTWGGPGGVMCEI